VPLELLVIELEDVTLDEAQPEELELPETEVVCVMLVDIELLTVTEGELVIEVDPVTETVLELDTVVLNDTDTVVVIVVETDGVGKEEDDSLKVVVSDSLGEPLDVKLTEELDDTDIDALLQLVDDIPPD
jgi:hypothetical protein